MARSSNEVNVRIIPFLAALLGAQLFGFLFHSRHAFGPKFAALTGKTEEAMNAAFAAEPFKTFVQPLLLGAAASALALYVAIHFYTFIKGGLTREGVVSVYFWGWLGFSALPGFATIGWTGSSFALFAIVQSHRLLAGIVAGVIYVSLLPSSKAAATSETSTTPAPSASSPRSRSRTGRSRTPRSRKQE